MTYFFKLSKLELIVFIFVFMFSFAFFYKDTFLLFYCLMAASITTALALATYMVLKWCLLAFK